MQETILAISGKAGLFKLVGRGNNTLIVETIDETHRRTTAGARDRVTSLADVTMYTEADDVPLMQVFQNICDALKGEPTSFGLHLKLNLPNSWTKWHFPLGTVIAFV